MSKIQEARDKHAAALETADAELLVAQEQYRIEFHGLDIHSVGQAIEAENAANVAMAASVAARPSADKAYRLASRELSKASIADRNVAVRQVRAAKLAIARLKVDWWSAWNRANVARYRRATLPQS